MTDYREINALQRDPPRARDLARYLLKLEQVQWTDWEADFLDTIAAIEIELSTRQAEKLVELRDNTVLYKTIDGSLSIKILIENCFLYRDELTSEHDQDFLVRLKTAGVRELRKPEAMRLMRCARALNEIGPHQGWSFR